MAAVPALNAVHSGMLNRNVTPEMPKESQRAAAARSLPRPSTTKPPTMGSQIKMANK